MESQVSYKEYKEQNNQFGVSKQHWKHRLKASLYPLVKELYNSTTIEMTWESLSDFDISLQYFKTPKHLQLVDAQLGSLM